MFDSLVGNDLIRAYLKKALLAATVPQTLLFSGIEGIGKRLFANELASSLLQSDAKRVVEETHPDLHILRPEGKSGLYAIDSLRTMIETEHSAPYEAPAKIFILEDAERMQPAAANALLKTLEEPTTGTTFILLSTAPQEMLPTILSRCIHLPFQPIPNEDIAQILREKGYPEQFAKRGHGSIGRALELATNPQLEMQRQILFRLLSEKPPYPVASQLLEKLDLMIEQEKEENPLRATRLAGHLFTHVLMWYRDQHLRKMDGPADLLFFPEESAVSYDLAPLKEIEAAIQEAHLAYQRNMKLSVCLKILI